MPKCCDTHAPTHVTGPSCKLSNIPSWRPMMVLPILIGTSGNVAAGTHVKPRGWQPGHYRRGGLKTSSFAVGTARRGTLEEGMRGLICDPQWIRGRNMSIRRKTVLITLAITLIGTAPAWSQSLVKTLDTDNDGTVDLAEA